MRGQFFMSSRGQFRMSLDTGGSTGYEPADARGCNGALALSPYLPAIACGDTAAELISALFTGTNLDVAAADQIRPIAITTASTIIHFGICAPLCVASKLT